MTESTPEQCCLCGKQTQGVYYRMEPGRCLNPNQHPNSRWTHALCDSCYQVEEPDRTPVRVIPNPRSDGMKTLTDLMDAITTGSRDTPNNNLCQFLRAYAPRLNKEARQHGFPSIAAAGMLSGIASVLQFIGENGPPSDLQEIMHGEKEVTK